MSETGLTLSPAHGPGAQSQPVLEPARRVGPGHPGATHLAPLTGLRLVAALLVVLHHFCHVFVAGAGAGGPIALAGAALGNVVASGFAGVNFFFILSGFILAYSYLARSGASLRTSRRDFWVARCARIYPLYLLAFILAAPPFVWNHDVTTPPGITGVSTLLLVQAWIPFGGTAWNPPGWSLSVEAFCYLLFPAIALAVARLDRRRLVILVGALCATSLGIALVYLLCGSSVLGLTRGMEGYWLRVVEFDPLLRLPQFALGVALGRLFVLKRDSASRDGIPPASGSWWQRRGVLIGGALTGIVGVLAIGPALPRVLLSHGPLDLLFALLIYNLAWGEGCLAAFFSRPALILLGEASYALYILQVPIWEWTVRLLAMSRDAALNSPVFVLAYLCLATGLSVLSLHYVERPARRAITAAFRPKRITPMPPRSQPGPVSAPSTIAAQ